MKLTFAQIAGFLQSPPASVRVILFYGPDAGLVSERAEAMASKLVRDKTDPFAVSQLTGAQVAAEPCCLYDEAASMALGGGRRLIRLQRAIESNATALARFLEEPPACDSVILIEAGDLEKKSKLRSLCEGASPLAAGIPCYLEDTRDRVRTVTAALQAEKLTAPREVIQLLAEILPPDRLAMRSELDKLTLYVMGTGKVTMEDVTAIIANAGGAEIDDLVQAAASGDVKRAATLIDHLYAEATSPVALLRGMQRHLMRLQLARAHMATGMGAGEAIKKLSPPVFWKLVEPMTRQLARWPLERIEARLAQLADAEAACKRTGTPDTTLTAQLFLNISAKG
ncbi:MAG TPA: DNA polymerase III subunit delta [Rhodospirillaceae bacterium]|nr:DNA polymerase III subunit delta [Rhodospirillaceae bacterium]